MVDQDRPTLALVAVREGSCDLIDQDDTNHDRGDLVQRWGRRDLPSMLRMVRKGDVSIIDCWLMEYTYIRS